MGRLSGPSQAPRWGLLFILVALACTLSVAAHAVRPPPLRRVHHPSRSTLRILPRTNPFGSVATRDLLATPESLRYDDTLMLSVSIPTMLPYDVHLLVSPVQNMFHPQAKVTFQDGNGVTTGVEALRHEDWKIYTGHVVRPSWAEHAWQQEQAGMGRNADAVIGEANIMIHEADDDNVQWEGTFDIGGQVFNVLTRENYNAVKTSKDANAADIGGGMVVYTDTDMASPDKRSDAEERPTCGLDNLAYNNNPLNPARARRDLPARFLRRDDIGGSQGDSNYIDSIGSKSGCPTDSNIVYMGVMLDCTYVAKFSSGDAARTNILTKWQMVSSLYQKTFKITLGLIEVIVKNGTCSNANSGVENEGWNVACDSKATLDDRLNSFSQWRGAKGEDGAGLWHLMTACQSETEVGVAWLGAVCTTEVRKQTDNTYFSGTGVSSATTTEWNVIAHEIGHGFGAIHDCGNNCTLSSTCCPLSKTNCSASGQYIMNPTTGSSETQFSPCTVGNICTFLGKNSPTCIQNVNDNKLQTISLNQCGNGIVEGDEQCDPGFNSTSSCCDASTCKFRQGAVCDPSNSACCTDSCQFAPKNTVCRPSINKVCDFEEVCSGTDAACPADKTAKDGTSCGANGLACASGHCTSLDAQCKSAGASMNLVQACGERNDKSCVVTCKDPLQDRVCQILQANLIDGSPCGYGGHCYNASCKAGPWNEVFNAMYRQNLQISIPVTVAVALVIFAIIWQLARCCCCRKGRSKPAPRASTNSRGGRPAPPLVQTWSHNGETPYQPIDDSMIHTPISSSKPSHSRGVSGSYTDLSNTVTGVPMHQMYSDNYQGSGHDYDNSRSPYGQAGEPYDPSYASPDYSNPSYDPTTQQQSHGYDPTTQQQSHGWVDPAHYNGPSYNAR